MATWFCRPDISHGATRNGLSYATAWGGWSEIVWGALGVSGGDTLNICGAHAYAAQITVGAHLASSEATRVTITGSYAPDPGSITFSGTAFMSCDRAWTTVRNLTINAAAGNAIFMSAAATNGQYLNNRLIGTNTSAPLISMYAINGQNHSNVLISSNYFTGTSLSAIRWLCAVATATSTINKLTIINNTIENLAISEGCLNLRAEDDTSEASIIRDLIIDNNVISSITYNAMAIGSDFITFGLCKGLKVRNNTIHNSASSSNASGGGMAPHSWGPSSTVGFGENEISGNVIRTIRGQTGGINLFDSTAYIHNNLIEDTASLTIDANGILIDIGCSSVVVTANEMNQCLGKVGVLNSGCALMALSGTDINMYSNIGNGNRNGVFYGASGAAQSINAYNNTLSGCIDNAFVCNASADLNNCTLKMNVFTGTGYSVFDATAITWTGEDYNCFYGFTSGASNHVLGKNDVFLNPLLDAKNRPLEPRVQRGNQPLAVIDFYGAKFSHSGPMGAVQFPYGNTLTTPRIIATLGHEPKLKRYIKKIAVREFDL